MEEGSSLSLSMCDAPAPAPFNDGLPAMAAFPLVAEIEGPPSGGSVSGSTATLNLSEENAQLKREVERLRSKLKYRELRHCKEINRLLYRLLPQATQTGPHVAQADPLFTPQEWLLVGESTFAAPDRECDSFSPLSRGAVEAIGVPVTLSSSHGGYGTSDDEDAEETEGSAVGGPWRGRNRSPSAGEVWTSTTWAEGLFDDLSRAMLSNGLSARDVACHVQALSHALSCYDRRLRRTRLVEGPLTLTTRAEVRFYLCRAPRLLGRCLVLQGWGETPVKDLLGFAGLTYDADSHTLIEDGEKKICAARGKS